MSSPIRVKQEEEPETQQQSDNNLSNVPSDDSETEDNNICIDNLQLLDPKVASQSKFPVGCKIWYDARKSRASKVLRAKSGHVVSVYFEFKSMSYVYRVKSSSSSQSADDDSCEHTLYEDRLMYGINCPVTVTNLDTNKAEDGVIVVPKLDVGKDGKQQISYAVQFEKGRHVSVEFLVAADRIAYREVRDNNEQVGINDGIEDEKEANITRGDAEMKDSKVDANLEEKAVVSMNERKEVAVTAGEVALNVREAGVSLGQKIATNKPEKDDDVRDVAPNEYSKLAGMTVPKNWRTFDVGATTASPSIQIGNEQSELEPKALSTSRWEPPKKDKTPQGKGGGGLERGSLSLERKRSLESEGSERPNKLTKTESLTCTLTIPKWVYEIRGRKHSLFRKCFCLYSFTFIVL